MLKGKKQHTHKLRKRKYSNGNAVYFCVLPECFFKVEAPFALGKISLCHECGEPFEMNEYTIRLTRPHCNSCGKRAVKLSDGTTARVSKRGLLSAVAESDVESLKDRLHAIIGDEEI